MNKRYISVSAVGLQVTYVSILIQIHASICYTLDVMHEKHKLNKREILYSGSGHVSVTQGDCYWAGTN